MSEVLDKIQFTRDLCEKLNVRAGGVTPKLDSEEDKTLPPFDIQVDGGINEETARRCFEAGANVLVAGTHLFSAPDMGAAVEKLRRI